MGFYWGMENKMEKTMYCGYIGVMGIDFGCRVFGILVQDLGF